MEASLDAKSSNARRRGTGALLQRCTANRKTADFLFTLPFLLVFLLDLAHHELWFDELNAWGLAAASPTLRALFANVHYEGHPWLWYFVLWIPSRFTHSPLAMKWVEAGIGSASYLVIGLFAPFTRFQKALVLLNYYIFFEYTVLSRTYGLMLLFVLLYLWRRVRERESAITLAILLGLLANTDVLGILLSGAFVLEYAVNQQQRRLTPSGRKLGAAVAIYAALLLFSFHTLRLAPDISWATTGHLFAHARSFKHFVHSFTDVTVAAWWPIARDYPHHFWNTDAEFNRYELLFAPFVLAALYWIFRKRRSLLVLVGASLVLALAFAHLVYIGYGRHWGITVVAVIAGLWILCGDGACRASFPRLAYVLLLVGSIKGVAAAAASWTHPFSETASVAGWIRAHQLADAPIAGASDYDLAGVAEQLQRPVYFLDCDCVDTYMKFSHRRDGLTPANFPVRVLHAFRELHAPEMLLVMDHRLSPGDLHSLSAEGVAIDPLAQFTGAEDTLEVYLYEARLGTGRAAGSAQ
jgi:hypothetical protein